MRYAVTAVLALSVCRIVSTSFGADDKPAKPAATASRFGIQPERISSPAVLDALNRLNEAGKVEGRRGSLTFFRWNNDSPPKLAHLGLWGAKVDNAELATAALLPDLEFLALHETNVDDDGLAAAAALPKLRSLSITPIVRYSKAGFGPPQWSYPFLARRTDRPRVTGKGLRQLAGMTALERVDLLDVVFTSGDLTVLAAWPKLSALSLPNEIDSATVRHLRECRKLNHLTLGYREISDEELKRLSLWKSLRKLTLIQARLSNEALTALATLETLEELRLEDCGLTDEHLEFLQPSPRLSNLILARNEIDGPGLKHLVPLRLRALGLEFNNIDDETLQHLPQLTTLEHLSLSYCTGITDRGIRLGTIQRMSRLTSLNLRGEKQVTDATLDDLAKFGHLDHLTLRETGVSWDGVARLKSAMPRTVVFK